MKRTQNMGMGRKAASSSSLLLWVIATALVAVCMTTGPIQAIASEGADTSSKDAPAAQASDKGTTASSNDAAPASTVSTASEAPAITEAPAASSAPAVESAPEPASAPTETSAPAAEPAPAPEPVQEAPTAAVPEPASAPEVSAASESASDSSIESQNAVEDIQNDTLASDSASTNDEMVGSETGADSNLSNATQTQIASNSSSDSEIATNNDRASSAIDNANAENGSGSLIADQSVIITNEPASEIKAIVDSIEIDSMAPFSLDSVASTTDVIAGTAIASLTAQSALKTQGSTVKVTIVFGGLRYNEDDGVVEVDVGGAPIGLDEVFASFMFDGSMYVDDDTGEPYAPVFGTALPGGTPTTFTLGGVTWSALEYDLDWDAEFTSDFFRVGYNNNGGFYVYELGDYFNDYDAYLAAGTVQDIADWFDIDDLPDNFDEDEEVASFTLLMAWVSEPYHVEVLNYDESTIVDELTNLTMASDVSSLLVEITSSNASQYGISWSDIPSNYEFAGYVLMSQTENDVAGWYVDTGNGYMILGDDDIYGSIPYVAPVSSGTYTLQQLYFALVGGTFPTTRFNNPANTLYPGYACLYPTTGDSIFDQLDVYLMPVFKEKDEEETSFTVKYYNTDANSANPFGETTKTYTSTSVNAETLSSLGFATPTANGYTISFAGWATSVGGTPSITSNGGSLSPLNPQNNGNYKLYAVWTKIAQTYKVTYNSNYTGGPAAKSDTLNVADSATDKAKNLTQLSWSARDGFSFGGWANSAANATAGTVYIAAGAAFSTLSPGANDDIGLFAIWTPITFTVNFKDSDGSTALASSIMGTTTKSYSTSVTKVDVVDANKTGYTFGGWKLTNASGSTVANSTGTLQSFTPTAGQTYTFAAIWNEITYTVNWLVNWNSSGAVGTASATSSVGYSNSAKLSTFTDGNTKLAAIADNDSGNYRMTSGGNTYQFTGWYVVKNGAAWDTPATGTTALGDLTLSQALATNGVTKTSNSLTIYAIWTKLGTLTVRYFQNPMTGSSDTNRQIGSASPFAGDNYTIEQADPTDTGFTFVNWNTKEDGTGTSYSKGNTISNISSSLTLYARWTPNSTTFVLNANTSDSTVVLNAKSSITAAVNDVVKASDLTTATPTRTGWEFKGWSFSSTATSSTTPDIGPADSDATYTVIYSDAPNATTANNVKNLYAIWEELTYSVTYNANGNSVTFTKTGTTNTVTSPYAWTAKTKRSDVGLDTPDITATRSFYTFAGWGTTAGATSGISATDQLGTLYDAQSGAINRNLNLYAIWTAATFDIYYVANSSVGTVTPTDQKGINLATGTDGDITGSTASVVTSGYKLATPTWTDVSGNPVTGVSTTAVQAKYVPTIAYLRSLYAPSDGSTGVTSITFYANFTEDTYAYEVQAFLQKADGTWNTTRDISITAPGGNDLEATFGTTVYHTDTVTGTGNTAVDGKALWELALSAYNTSSVENSKLFDFDSSNANNVMSFAVAADTSKNVLKLYYTRKTYELTAEFKTTKNSSTTAGAPSSVTATPASFLNGGSSTTSVRWGQSIPVSTPFATGYDFAWSVTTPTTPVSPAPGVSFTLTAADMAKIYNSATPQAVLTGTFTVKQYTITLSDASSDSPHNNSWSTAPTTAGPGLNSSPYTAQQSVDSDGTLGAWVPVNSDSPTATVYFAGWRDDSDSTSLITSDTLKAMTNWSSNKSFTAIWLPKVVVTYDPGDADSNGKSKAAWTAATTSLSNVNTSGTDTTILSTTGARFVTLVGSSYVDGNNNPKGAEGWEFAYWAVDGSNQTVGHASAYNAGGTDIFLEGTQRDGSGTSHGWLLTSSVKFIAHWNPVQQTVTVSASGSVDNNSANSDTVTAVLPSAATSKTYNTDDTVNLADYTPTSIPAGYTLAGWKWTYTDSSNNKTNGTYGPTATFRVKVGTTAIEPFFNEDTVTFKYEVESGSVGKGTISPSGSDTVFAVKHNTINDHTANPGDTAAYQFVSWTYNGSTLTTSNTLTSSDMGISSTEVLTADRTFYASFETKKYTIRFMGKGTDGTNEYAGAVVADTAKGANANNAFELDWNTTVPTDGITVNVPLGYKLDGWIVNGSGSAQKLSGATAANYQGIYNYKVTSDVTMQAHFIADTDPNFTVYYKYDPENISGFTSTETSNTVAWEDSVLPQLANNATPTRAGYIFDGWYARYDSAGTTAATKYLNTVAAWGPSFGKIYNALVAAGATAPNVDTTAGNESITIYAKWTAPDFTVTYDFYGNVANDPSTANDDVVLAGITSDPKTVKWNDKASAFKYSETDGLSRPGYTLSGWKAAVVTTADGTIETSTGVQDSDTYGDLANNNDSNKKILLSAIWTSKSYNVVYQYNDADSATPTSDKTESKGWADQVDYYTLGAAPSRDGYTFDGWDVKYTGTKNGSLATLNGDRITAAGNTTMRDIVKGDTKALESDPVITFTAHWTAVGTYSFQDRLIHLDGTWEDKDNTSTATVNGNTVVMFSQYGTPKTTYVGYDFDNHTATNPNWTLATPTQATVNAGGHVTYYVYYLERSYDIDYFVNDTDASGTYLTNGNAYDSAAPILPTVTPTKAGYKFDGWYLQDTANTTEIKLDGTNKVADLFATAPANGATLKAVGKWTEDTATISWSAAANGSVSPADGSETRNATDTGNAIAAITATPASSDYTFFEWTYSYVDGNGDTQTGSVNSLSPFATLSKSAVDDDTLTPIPWAMSTGDNAVWHTIAFTANFMLSSALKVTIEYYLEDFTSSNDRGNYTKNIAATETRTDAEDGKTYTVTSPKTFAGYSLNSGLTDDSHTYVYDNASTHVFKIYYSADAQTVSYRYVETDGSTTQTAPTGAPATSTFNGGTYYTGQTFTVDAAPTLASWQFKGWFTSDAYDGANVSGTGVTVGATGLELVGTWAQNFYTVQFIDTTDATVVGPSVTTVPSTGYSVADGGTLGGTYSAATMNALGVTANNNGAAYAPTGWKVLVGGLQQGSAIGFEDPLSYPITANTVFEVVWKHTYTVTYTRGLHGAFFASSNPSANTYVEFENIQVNAALSPSYDYNGTLDSNSLPNANNGWQWVGWGSTDGTNWTYYFADVAADNIDYGTATRTNGAAATMPTNVTDNIEFVGFYKPLDRTVYFSTFEYDSTPIGTESSKAYDPVAGLASGAPSSVSVKTGQNATMLDVNQVVRDGYTLTGWTDGSKMYTPGSMTEFVMPEIADGLGYYLYPVFSFDQMTINYDVADDSTGRGNVDRTSDTKNNPTDTVNGSTPIAKPGYEFDYWTKDSDTTHLGASDGVDATTHQIVPTASGTYHAHFSQKDYSFEMKDDPDVTGVTMPTGALPSTSSPAHWTDNVTLDTPTRTGYTFAGWDVYEAGDFGTNKTSGTKLHTAVPAGSTTVSALSSADGNATELVLVPTWTAIVYSVTFADGKTSGTGSVSGMPTTDYSNVEYTDTITAADPTRDGYAFAGWLDSVTNTTIASLSAGSAYSALVTGESDTSVTLTAQWTPNTHTLTYAANGGTWSATEGDYPTGDPAATTAADAANPISTATDAVHTLRTGTSVTRAGWKLTGWNDGTTNYLLASTTTFTMPDDDVTLTAIWEESGDYNVKYNTGSTDGDVTGTPTDRNGVKYGITDVKTDAPTRPGYTFDGWVVTNDDDSSTLQSITSGFGTDVAYAAMVGDDDSIKSITFTAQWTAKTAYQVTFEAPSGATVNNPPADAPVSPATTLGFNDDVDVQAKDALGAYTVPIRAGHTFAGWEIYADSSHTTKLGDLDSTVTTKKFSELEGGNDLYAHLYLVSKWTANDSYTVTFDANAGTDPVNNMPDNAPVSPATTLAWIGTVNTLKGGAAPTRAGWTFGGWTITDTTGATIGTVGATDASKAFNELAQDNDVGTNKDLTLKAIWTEREDYQVTFEDGDGGNTATNMPTNVATAKWADNITTLAGGSDPVFAGHSFTGWTVYASDKTTVLGTTGTNPLTGASYSFSTLAGGNDIAANAHLYLIANWADNSSYTVAFNADAGTDTVGNMPANVPATGSTLAWTGNVSVKDSAGDPTRAGYTFAGWTVKDNKGVTLGTTGTNPLTASSYTFSALAQNNDTADNAHLTLYANWTAKQSYTVRFNANTTDTVGNLPTTKSNLAWASTVDVRAVGGADPTRDGYTFAGWTVKDSASPENVLGGTDSAPLTNASYAYSFLADGIDTADTAALTLYAQWTQLSDYNVKFEANDATGTPVTTGTMPADQTGIAYDTTGINVAGPTRKGYTFGGWTNSAGGTVAASTTTMTYAALAGSDSVKTVTLTAIWTANLVYKVTYADGVPGTSTTPFTGTLPTNRVNIGFDADDIAQTELNTTGTDRAGFTFTGWEVTNDADGAVLATITSGYTANAVYSTLVGGDDAITAITFTAQWAGAPYTVTYHLTDGGAWDDSVTDGDDPITYYVEATVDLRDATTVTRDGYTLKGWANGTDATATDYKSYIFENGDTSFKMPASDVDLYSLWTALKYAVTFVPKNASDTGSATVGSMPADLADITYDANVAHTAPARNGYTFGGWDVFKTSEYDADASTAVALRRVGADTSAYSALAADPSISALTLVAVWTAQNFGVKYTLVAPEATLVPKWVEDNITDDGKGKPADADAVVGYDADSEVHVRPANTVYLAGYTLIGWSTTNSPTSVPEYKFADNTDSFTMPAGNVYLYSIFERNTGYAVTFEANEPTTNLAPGATIANMPLPQSNLEWDGAAGLVATGAPTFTGYTFKGWRVYGTDDVEITNSTSYPLTGPAYYFNVLAGNVDSDAHKTLKLVAQWEISNGYSVSFLSGVGSGETPVDAGTMPANVSGITYITDVDHAAPTRAGYTFDGWEVWDVSDNLNPNQLADASSGTSAYYELAGNPAYTKLELEAKWIEREWYEVTFDGNGAGDSVGNVPDGAVDLKWTSSVTTLKGGTAPTRSGHIFAGWNIYNASTYASTALLGTVSASDASKLFSQLAQGNDVAANYHLYLVADWTASSGYSVMFSANAGSDAVDNMPAPVTGLAWTDTVATKDSAGDPARIGYTFAGWTITDKNGNALGGTDVAGSYYNSASDTFSALAQGVDSADTEVLTLVAQWTEKGGYKVVFDAATTDAVANMPTTPQDNLAWSDTVTTKDAAGDPERAGFTFEGWTIKNSAGDVLGGTDVAGSYYNDPSAAFSALAQGDDSADNAELTLVAVWTAKGGYKVAFDAATTDAVANMPTSPQDNLAWGDDVSTKDAAGDPARAGYEFQGWTITDKNGAALGGTDTAGSYYNDASAAFSALAQGDDSADNAELTLVANWTPKSSYKVTFDADTTDAVANMPTTPQDNLAWSDDVSTKDAAGDPARAGYDFGGWTVKDKNGNAIGSVAAATASEKFSALAQGDDSADNAELTLVAVWTAKGGYKVAFDAATTDAVANMPTSPQDNLAWGDDVSTKDAAGDPARAGYEFQGWTITDKNGAALGGTDTAGSYYNDASAAFSALAQGDDSADNAELTLVANWTPKQYAYKFDAATTDAVTNMPVGASAISWATDAILKASPGVDPARTGYTFAGWTVTNKNGDTLGTTNDDQKAFNELAQNNDIADNEELTLVANWTQRDDYNVYFKTGDDSGATKVTPGTMPADREGLTFDAADIAALAPARAGYTFGGWSSDVVAVPSVAAAAALAYTDLVDGDGSIVSVTLTAVWNAIMNYQVTYKDGVPSTSTTPFTGTLPADPTHVRSGLGFDADDIEQTELNTTGADRPGFIFKGWEVTNDADNTVLTTISSNYDQLAVYSALVGGDETITAITFTALWEGAPYTVTYHRTDGTTEGAWAASIVDGDDPITYYMEETVVLRDADSLVAIGKKLTGWYDNSDPVNNYVFANGDTSFQMPAKNVDLYPLFADKYYTVVFEDSNPTNETAYVRVVTNMPASPQDNLTWTSTVDTQHPALDGYEFKGWTVKDAAATGALEGLLTDDSYTFDALALVDTDEHATLTLVANWDIALIYNAIFKDGVVPSSDPDHPVTPVSTMPADQMGLAYVDLVSHEAATRLGYTFENWTVVDITDESDKHDLGTVNAGETAYYLIAGNAGYTTLEFTANWTQKMLYNVHFVDKPADDARPTPVNMGTLVDLLGLGWDENFNAAPAPTRAGYSFDHWAVTNTTDASDVKSIGQATAGSYLYSELAYDQTTGLQDDTIYDITMTAVWVPNEHTVTYVVDTDAVWNSGNITDAGAATPNAPITYSVDDTVVLRDATTITLAGFELTGWKDNADPVNNYVFANGDADFIMPDADVELYPVWLAKEYTVKFEEGEFTVYDAALQVVAGMPANPQEHLLWTSDVDTANPTLAGYTFAGWLVKDAAATGANTDALMNASYAFNELALTDTDEHRELTLVAQWTPASYRVTYVDPFDANGAVAATPALVVTNANLLWTGTVPDADPWTVYGANYAGKSNVDWQFDGWSVKDASGAYVATADAADMLYSTLAGIQGLAVADVATDADEPALVLYASWTRRVPFVVDFVKVAKAAGGTAAEGAETIESSTTLVGLDGQVIDAATDPMWLTQALNLGDAHTIVGYTYNRADSAADARNLGKALDAATQLGAGNELHLVLLYDQRLDYLVTYVGFDGTGGWLAADLPAETTQATGASPAWETPGASFAPVDADWFYRGHKIVNWTYGPTGTEYVFDAADGMTFARIAEAIYGQVDGTEGTAAADGTIAKPVELHAVWSEKDDYKVVYDDNYKTGYANNGIVDKFLGRIPDLDNPYTPGDTEDVEYSSSSIEPEDQDGKIVEPGVTDDYQKTDLALYRLVGWNYSATGDGNNQKPAEGKTFEQIVDEIASNQDDPLFDPASITLYARWEEVPMELTYTAVRVVFDEATGAYVEEAGSVGGSVSRTSETIDGAISWTSDSTGAQMIARGATVSVNPGWHFVGWKRVSDGEVIYAAGWDPASEAARLAAQSAADGNVLPGAVAEASDLFRVMQNETDGYWHSEEYQALFAQNDAAVLHYDKNAEDATGTIDDVEEPYGTLLTLSNGSPFKRTYWKLVSWNTESDGSGTTYKLGEKDWPMPEGETTLYAQWEKVPAAVKYNKNGSGVTGMPSNEKKEWGEEYELSGDEPTRKHYVFTGWNTEPDGSGDSYEPGDEYLLEGSGLTLYAQWELAKYDVEVTEPTKGGTVTINGDVSEIEYGSYVPKGMYTAEADDGYHLVKWKYTMVDEDGNVRTGYVSDPSKLKVLGQVTFEPVFAKDKTTTPSKPDDPKKPSKNKQQRNRTTNRSAAASTGVAGTTGGYLARTADTLGLVVGTLLTAALAALATLLVLFARRKREQQ